MSELMIAVGMFTLIVLMLVSVIMFAKAKLLPSGDVQDGGQQGKRAHHPTGRQTGWAVWRTRAFLCRRPAAAAAPAASVW